jgi:type IV secretory pathway TrbD component
MDRLSLVLTLFTGPVLTGGFVIVALSAGFYGWASILTAAGAGLLLTWPVAYWISRWIKKDDPGWDHRHADWRTLPDPKAREV